MADNVVSLDEYRPHLAGPARCLHCQHEWAAVSPVGVYAGLVCPQCGLDRGVRKYLVFPDAQIFTCFCGCDVYTICRRRGPMCLNCGEIARGFDE